MTKNPKVKGGGKLQRTEVVTVRFDPWLRHALELGARKQRRTVSSLVEWAVEEVIQKITVEDEIAGFPKISISELMGLVWDVDPADRFVKLAENYPGLLTYEEERIWKTIKENKDIFYYKNGKPNYQLIRDSWEDLQKHEWNRPKEEV